ncbi:hypothetical protein [Zobellia galactanivorans]|uniref:Uncharacterized protein n=1 Tax=Zobellia galactanivorans (strain DSM 12802 / CCUG 47099 / CIP 106680 / NCIMB 13871 / Dsij) TaxID=63186 RepID=G0L485_ZOBGA|nr:hypothetical protein [Zobellia galactanivorans]CAZ98723.1 Putative protein [Zobellia galactanivorans]
METSNIRKEELITNLLIDSLGGNGERFLDYAIDVAVASIFNVAECIN